MVSNSNKNHQNPRQATLVKKILTKKCTVKNLLNEKICENFKLKFDDFVIN